MGFVAILHALERAKRARRPKKAAALMECAARLRFMVTPTMNARTQHVMERAIANHTTGARARWEQPVCLGTVSMGFAVEMLARVPVKRVRLRSVEVDTTANAATLGTERIPTMNARTAIVMVRALVRHRQTYLMECRARLERSVCLGIAWMVFVVATRVRKRAAHVLLRKKARGTTDNAATLGLARIPTMNVRTVTAMVRWRAQRPWAWRLAVHVVEMLNARADFVRTAFVAIPHVRERVAHARP